MEQWKEKENIGGTIPDWLSLPEEIWSLIISKLVLEDHIRCQSVSSFFFSIAKKQQCSSLPRVPWLMHRVDNDIDMRILFDMTSNKVYKIQLPELRGSIILGSSEGWLILVDELTSELRLFSPFTRDEIQLPPTITFPGIVGADRDSRGQVKEYHLLYQQAGFQDVPYECIPQVLSKMHFISASMISSNSGYIVVVGHIHGGFGLVRAGENNAAWTALQIPDGEPHKCNFTFFNDLLYVMDDQRMVLSFDLSSIKDNSPPPPPLQVAPTSPNMYGASRSFNREKSYLVLLPDNGELLLLVNRYRRIRAFKLVGHKQQTTMQWVEVRTLFGHSLFLTSKNHVPPSIICLSSNDHPAELKKNCIYFTEGGSVKRLDIEDRKRRIKSYPLSHVSQKLGEDHREPIWIHPVITSL